MKNFNWSKWIAVALSVFILVQFVQVSFLAARQVGSGSTNAGADASRGSIAEELYQNVWETVGDSDELVLNAKADSEPGEGDPANPDLTNPDDANPDDANPDDADPANADPANADPANADPANADPANADPANADPANADPANADPANADPENADPANPAAGASTVDNENPATGASTDAVAGASTDAAAGASTDAATGASTDAAEGASGNAAAGASGQAGTGASTVIEEETGSGTASTATTGATAAAASNASTGASTGASTAKDKNDGITTPATMTVSLESIDNEEITSSIDLTDKDAADTTSYTFAVSVSAGSLADLTSTIRFSGQFSLANATATLSSNLLDALQASVSGSELTLTGSGSLLNDVRGTVTLSGVKFVENSLPASSTDTDKAIGSIIVGGSAMDIKLPLAGDAKNRGNAVLRAGESTVVVSLTTGGGIAPGTTTLDLSGLSSETEMSFVYNITATANTLPTALDTIGFSDHFDLSNAKCEFTKVTGEMNLSATVSKSDKSVTLSSDGATLTAAAEYNLTISGVKWNGASLPLVKETTGDGSGAISQSRAGGPISTRPVRLPAISHGGDITLTVKCGTITSGGKFTIERKYDGTYKTYAYTNEKDTTKSVTGGVWIVDSINGKTVTLCEGEYKLTQEDVSDSAYIKSKPATFTVSGGKVTDTSDEVVCMDGKTLIISNLMKNESQTKSFKIKRVIQETGGTETPVSGAKYSVFSATKNPDGTLKDPVLIDSMFTDSAGSVTLTVDKDATVVYVLEDKNSPGGDTWKYCRIGETGQANNRAGARYAEVNFATLGSYIYYLLGPKTGTTIAVQLVDAEKSNENIAGTGASYQLVKAKDLSEVSAMTVSTKGLVQVHNVPAGTYQIKEVKWPNGYKIDPKNISTKRIIEGVITVSDTFEVTYPEGNAWIGGTQEKLAYNERRGILAVVREDVNMTSTVPDPMTYGVFTTADCTGEPVETIKMQLNTLEAMGAVENLSWGTNYYLKETSADKSGYTKDPNKYGPYQFSPTMDYNTERERTDLEHMTIYVTASPDASTGVTVDFEFNSQKLGNKAAAPMPDGSKIKVTGVFADKSEVQTLTFASGKATCNQFIAGNTYKIIYEGNLTGEPAFKPTTCEMKVVSDENVTVTSDVTGENAPFAVGVPIVVVGPPSTITNPLVVLYAPYTLCTFVVDICTAEQGSYSNVDAAAEIIHKSGIEFTYYSDAGLTPVTYTFDRSGNQTAVVTTDDGGNVDIYGLPDKNGDKTYHRFKCTTKEEALDGLGMKQLNLDSLSTFVVFTENGVKVKASRLASNTGPWTWSSSTGPMKAVLKSGSITVKTKAAKWYSLYRLYDGGGSIADGRCEEKVSGKLNRSISTTEGVWFAVTNLTASLDPMDQMKKLFMVTAKAASVQTINAASNTWELISAPASVNSNSSKVYKDLVAGQPYLVREGDSQTFSDKDRLVLVTATMSGASIDGNAASTATTASSSKTGSSGKSTTATTAKSSSNTGKTSGSGTGNNGGGGSNAGGGRNSATGDTNDLWVHLIIMLIAFDALVADLLYISRKKQRA